MKKTCIICDACGQVAVGVGYATLAAALRLKGWMIFSTHEHVCPACRAVASVHDEQRGGMSAQQEPGVPYCLKTKAKPCRKNGKK